LKELIGTLMENFERGDEDSDAAENGG